MKQVVRLLSETQKSHAVALVQSASSDMVMTLAVYKEPSRTIKQNNLLHKWCDEIATQKGDETALDVKTTIKVRWGLDILTGQDPDQYMDLKLSLDYLSYAMRLRILRDQPVTSRLHVKPMKKLLDIIFNEYTQHGFILTIPNEEQWGHSR